MAARERRYLSITASILLLCVVDITNASDTCADIGVRQGEDVYTVDMQNEHALTVSCTHDCVPGIDEANMEPHMTIQNQGDYTRATPIYNSPCNNFPDALANQVSPRCVQESCIGGSRRFSLEFQDISTAVTVLNNSVIHCGVRVNIHCEFYARGISFIRITNSTLSSPTPAPTSSLSITPSPSPPPACVYSSDVPPSLGTVADTSSIQPSQPSTMLAIAQTSPISPSLSSTAVESSLDTVRQTSESHSTTTDTSSARNTAVQSSVALSATVLGTQPTPSASVSVTITVPPPSITESIKSPQVQLTVAGVAVGGVLIGLIIGALSAVLLRGKCSRTRERQEDRSMRNPAFIEVPIDSPPVSP